MIAIMSVSSVQRRLARVVPERFGWSLSVLLALAVLYVAGCVAALVAHVVQLVSWIQPQARLPITFPTSYELLGFGSTVTQLLQGAANLGLRAFAWGAPDVQNRLLIRTDGLTLEFTPLFFSIVLLALALVLRRGALLQRETDGLV